MPSLRFRSFEYIYTHGWSFLVRFGFYQKNNQTETGSNWPVSVRFGFLGQKPVQTGLARFFRFGSVWLGFFSGFLSVSVRFGFFSFLFIKPNRTGWFFQKFNRFNRFFFVRFFRLFVFWFSRFNQFSGFFLTP